MQNKPIQLLDSLDGVCYTLTLAPGLVRYLKFEDFLEAEVEDAITHIRRLCENPEIDAPHCLISAQYNLEERFAKLISPDARLIILDLEGIEKFMEGQSWDARLRLHHKLGWLHFNNAMPTGVYVCFHSFLHLKGFAFDECLKAWVKEALDKSVIINSYRKSSDHFIVAYDGRRFAEYVFVKTPFVKEMLYAFAATETEKKAADDLELLRRSKFDCYIYLMEDLRNRTFKIGKSKTPRKRERTLQSEVPQIIMRFSIPADEMSEKELHDHFDDKRIRGEWFALTTSDLTWVVSFLKIRGDTSRAVVDFDWLGKIHFNA